MRYHQLGQVPRKRHTQFRTNGRLLVEEVMGLEGFSGNESILYHHTSPCRILEAGEFEPISHEEWVPDAHVHRHLETGGDPGRRRLDHGSPLPDVEQGPRGLDLPAERRDRGLLPERRGGRADLRP